MVRLLILLLLVAPLSWAEPLANLEAELAGLGTLQGLFEQQVLDTEQNALSSSSGEFRLLQPGYFYWHIRTPDEQVLYATGNTLWHYDVELETATRRDIAAQLSQSPLAVFSGDRGSVAQLYDVTQPAVDEYRLTPRFDDASFVSIRLQFTDGLPATMWVLDRLEQTTQIVFHDLETSIVLTPQAFSFNPPEGVDVYYHER